MSVNKVILVGNVGKDPEVRYFENGSVVANFTLATTERGYTTANGITVPDRTEWHNIVVWRGLAKVVEQFVRTGSQLYLEGKIRSRTYDDANGVKRYVSEIYVDNMELLGRRRDDNAGTLAPAQQTPKTQAETPNNFENSADDIDDLPF